MNFAFSAAFDALAIAFEGSSVGDNPTASLAPWTLDLLAFYFKGSTELGIFFLQWIGNTVVAMCHAVIFVADSYITGYRLYLFRRG